MRIGSVREIKKFEYRVGLTPDNVKSYVNAGHQVYIERNAGVGSGFMTEDYVKAGATILETAREVWETAEMIVKVKDFRRARDLSARRSREDHTSRRNTLHDIGIG